MVTRSSHQKGDYREAREGFKLNLRKVKEGEEALRREKKGSRKKREGETTAKAGVPQKKIKRGRKVNSIMKGAKRAHRGKFSREGYREGRKFQHVRVLRLLEGAAK